MSAQPKSLFESTAAPASLGWYELHIPLAKIDETPGHNPRKDYGEDDGSFAALVESIRERGMQQYPRLWPVADLGGDWDPLECRFTIVSGHRRIAAARALGWESVRVCVPDAEGAALAGYTEGDKLIDALAENLQRKDLNCIEVAEGIGRLEAYGRTQEQIARLIGKSQGRASRTVRLLELPYGVRALLRDGGLSQSCGEELLPLVGSGYLPAEIEAIAYKAIEAGLSAKGLASVIKIKLEDLQGRQHKLFAPNNSTPASEPEGEEPEDEIDARIARTLASTKGMDKEPAPAPKETNGLTRGESDKQFAEAMAPDPDVIPLSERPTPVPTPISDGLRHLHITAPSVRVTVEGIGANALAALVVSDTYSGHSIEAIVEAILVRRAVELGVMESPAKATETAKEATPEPEAEEVIHSATVAYCYPQGGAWQGGGAVEMEDGVPSFFDDLAKAREFAREQSDRFHNRRFLIHVLSHLEYPKRKSDRAVMRGDLWYFRGQQVPGGISNSIPSAENLAAVGCVLEELRKEAQGA